MGTSNTNELNKKSSMEIVGSDPWNTTLTFIFINQIVKLNDSKIEFFIRSDWPIEFNYQCQILHATPILYYPRPPLIIALSYNFTVE
ncbi:hypothetical protein RclHR1_03880009 [Rhizophagus clarus]|uniref:Uncharacterized protein n=1 Tax=Rhizophagus clarus TaxID=94130 RepID=A0A2Z6S881_9GLOM|nr:hypothetical protein RclHR1_03880009 [Rhizophagus clarus]GET01695.1 hypothetical protein RCL_jg11233.t1 [Rhizophagus clarus]